jgi:vacuolar-type H+-ATPase subunit H
MQELIQKYNLDQTAAQEGGRNNPPPTATTLSSVEQQIVRDFSSTVDQKRKETLERAGQLQAHRNSIENSLNIDNKKTHLATISNGIREKITRLLHQINSELIANRKLERQRLAYLNSFRQIHHRIDEAVYPESKIFHWAIVLALVVIESGLNGYFFAKGSEIGYLGGINQALLVSLANIGVSIMVGTYVIRNLHHIEGIRRGWGTFGLVLWIGFILIFNLGVAHYRTALGENPETALKDAVTRFLSSPLGVGDFDSWLIFVIGIVAATFALIKGYTDDDRYPGYGDIARRYKRAEASYSESVKSAKTSSLKIIDAAHLEARGVVEEIRLRIHEFEHSIQQTEAYQREFESAVQYCLRTVNALLKHFRQNNSKVRTVPAPAYFSQEFAFLAAEIQLPILLSEKEMARWQEYRTVLQTFVHEEERVQADLHEMSREFSETNFPAFIDSVEEAAVRQITADTGFALGPR